MGLPPPLFIRAPQRPQSTVTWNPSDKGAGTTLSNGNLTSSAGGTLGGARGTVSHATGKRYFEFTWDSGIASGNANTPSVGVATSSLDLGAGGALVWYGTSLGVCFYPAYDGSVYDHLYASTGGPVDLNIGSASAGNVGGVYVDIDAGKVWFARNGVVANSGNPATGTGATLTLTGGLTLFPAMVALNAAITARFRSDDWMHGSYGFVEW